MVGSRGVAMAIVSQSRNQLFRAEKSLGIFISVALLFTGGKLASVEDRDRNYVIQLGNDSVYEATDL